MKANKKIMAIVAVIALVAILGVCLVACNASSYTKKLEKKGYTVIVYEGSSLEDYGNGFDLKWGLRGSKGKEYVRVLKFKKTADAKAFYNDAKEVGELVGGDFDIYRTGALVITGSKQGVKDAK